MASKLGNDFFEQLCDKQHDMNSDTFKIILMASGFVFNRATHVNLAAVTASQLATNYGYTAGGATLSGVSLAQDDVNNGANVTWSNATWNISGGSITASGAIIYNDTHASDLIVGYIDFGGDQTCLSGGTATVANIAIALRG
jgi:hypothetical protein